MRGNRKNMTREKPSMRRTETEARSWVDGKTLHCKFVADQKKGRRAGERILCHSVERRGELENENMSGRMSEENRYKIITQEGK